MENLDPKEFLKTVNTTAEAQSNILPNIIGSATGSVFSQYELNDVVTTDQGTSQTYRD